MLTPLKISEFLAILLWAVSLGSVLSLGSSLLTGVRFTEKLAGRIISTSAAFGLALSISILCINIAEYPKFTESFLGSWLQFGGHAFELDIDITRTTAIFLVMAHIIFSVVARFARNYLLRDPGYQRFMFLFSVLQFGLILIASVGSMELLVVGWEIVGMASFLLIGFFVAQRTTGERSLNAFVSYKIADVALIFAALLIHHAPVKFNLDNAADFAGKMLASGNEHELFFIGLLIILGTLAKGSQFPFITWMPRAMEGPTPSSAAFYGGLSVHLAPLLLLRTFDIWFWSADLRLSMGVIGAVTAGLGTLIGRTQANVKGQLSYAVMAQIGLIYIELAMGWDNVALAHVVGHASLRTVQYLRSSSLIADFARNREASSRERKLVMSKWRQLWYIHAWNGFYWETIISRFFVCPFLKVSNSCSLLLRPKANRDVYLEIIQSEVKSECT